MKHFFWGGRGVATGQSRVQSKTLRHYDRNVMERSIPEGLNEANLINRMLRLRLRMQIRDRLLLPLGRNRSDVYYITIIFCVLFSQFVFTRAVAQTQSRSMLVGEVCSAADGLLQADPVMLGFRVPEEFWSREFTVFQNGKYTQQTLAKYRGKPLILDFWATWCTSCMPNFPKLDRFKEHYGDNINFLLVNSYDTDTAKVVDIFMGKKYAQYRTKTPSVLFDSYLKQLFPHQAVPIFIWLDDFGRLRATSTSDFLNDNQIEGLISRRKGGKK